MRFKAAGNKKVGKAEVKEKCLDSALIGAVVDVLTRKHLSRPA